MGAFVVLGTFALWSRSGDRVLALRFAAAATGAAFGAFLIEARNRRKRRRELERAKQARIEEKRRRVENKRRLAERRGTLVASVHDMMPQLDHHLATTVIGSEHSPRGRIIRTPMKPGRGSHGLNRVRIDHPGATADLVEKAVANDSNELAFWQETQRARGLALRGRHYDSIEPFGIVAGTTSSVLYFPYLTELHRDRETLLEEFRSNRGTIVSAVADFNGRNIVTSRPIGTNPTFVANRPTQFRLERNLGVSASTAKTLLRSWNAVYERWPLVETARERIPHCLCHHDVSPGNALEIEGVTTFVDFGLAGFAPLGSDLHSIIRWSPEAMEDPDLVEDLFHTYLEGARPIVPTLELEDLRLVAWSTYYLRYTNLKFRSARDLRSFELAIDMMDRLLQERERAAN